MMTTGWLWDDFGTTLGQLWDNFRMTSEHSESTQRELKEQESNQTSSYHQSLKYFVLAIFKDKFIHSVWSLLLFPSSRNDVFCLHSKQMITLWFLQTAFVQCWHCNTAPCSFCPRPAFLRHWVQDLPLLIDASWGKSSPPGCGCSTCSSIMPFAIMNCCIVAWKGKLWCRCI